VVQIPKADKHRNAVNAKVVELVKEERKDQPRVGTRKLYEALHPSFEAEHIKVGRDSLFDILREHSMLVRRKKLRAKPPTRTTVSTSTAIC
jgi:hypothetical protein